MSEKWKLLQSREKWKQKAIERGRNERALRKEVQRMKQERNRYKQQTKLLKDDCKQHQQQNRVIQPKKLEVIYLALSLFLVARIGFRATSRVLKVLSTQLGLAKAPCAQTISNWVTRLSIIKTQGIIEENQNKTTERFMADFVWLIDQSIGLGCGKILSVLALNLKHHKEYTQSPKLSDVTCIAVSVAASWTGENIAAFLKTVIKSVGGSPCAFLKDGGTDLAKAVSILNDQGILCASIADISHIIANLFKHKYAKHPLFELFISTCGQVSKNLKQTLLASLAPPKIAVNARFMNLHQLVLWANNLLKHSSKGNAAEGSMLAKLRKAFEQLPECKNFIKQFLRDATPLLECQKIIKCEGLNRFSYAKCEKILEVNPISPSISLGFKSWAEEHLAIGNSLELDGVGLPISSDSLESLFGVGKRLGTGQVKDANRIASRLPAFCGTLSREDVQRVAKVSVTQQKNLVGGYNSLVKQRRDVLSNPGKLETLANSPTQKNLQLITSFPKIQTSMQLGVQPNTA